MSNLLYYRDNMYNVHCTFFFIDSIFDYLLLLILSMPQKFIKCSSVPSSKKSIVPVVWQAIPPLSPQHANNVNSSVCKYESYVYTKVNPFLMRKKGHKNINTITCVSILIGLYMYIFKLKKLNTFFFVYHFFQVSISKL